MSGIGLHLTFGRGASGPPDLTPVAGYSAWLDPRRLSTLFQDDADAVPVAADGDLVTRWHTRAGTTLILQADVAGGYSTPIYRETALNGYPCIDSRATLYNDVNTARSGQGGGANAWSNGALGGAGGATVFAVCAGQAAATASVVIPYGAGNVGFVFNATSLAYPAGSGCFFWNGGTRVDCTAAPVDGDAGHVYCFGWDTTTLYAGVDDLSTAALQTAAYPNPVARLAADGCQGLSCNRNQSQLPPLLGDLIIYPSWLAEADRLENANMLAAKFGL